MNSGLIELIKTAALDAVDATNPCDIRYGVVTAVNPISIFVSQNFILPQDVLVIPKTLTRHEVTLMSLISDDTGEEEVDQITEDTFPQYTYVVDNSLKVGDNVILIREAGGKKYVVLDKVVNT